MISILNNSFLRVARFVGAMSILMFFPLCSFAQNSVSQTLSVSPTLFQMTATPKQTWQSEIRVINVNDYDLTIFPQVVNFAPKGESGRGDFLPVFSNETNGQTLAEWIDLSPEGVVIPKQQTVTLPFTITVPEGAAPGGHYAAILIGTKPAAGKSGESLVQTAQFVSSLFFVRISGDVVEDGAVREFRTTKSLFQVPEVGFEVRFENTGNVHLQPQGDISIFNMWGEERGTIPINHQTHFGNVLPDSIRKFEFTWKGEESTFDIGRYRAVVTLGYGEDGKKFTTSTTYFWIVPYQQILIFGFSLVALIWFFTFAVKMYIRRMLLLAGIAPQPSRSVVSQGLESTPQVAGTVRVARYHTATAPVRTSLQDLATRLQSVKLFRLQLREIVSFVYVYKLFFIALLVLGICIAMSLFILERVNKPSRPYEVTIENPDAPLTISSEAIYYDTLKSQGAILPATIVPEYSDFSLALVNVSGELGVAASLRLQLESKGYHVTSVSGDIGRADERTVIIYHPDDEAAALALSKQLGGALVSSDSTAKQSELTINVGKDQSR